MIGAVRGALARFKIDPYILAILATVVFASLVPARGEAADVVGIATKIGVALVFFLHGAKLSPQAVVAGIAHWRLHLVVLSTTFALFPDEGTAQAAVGPFEARFGTAGWMRVVRL